MVPRFPYRGWLFDLDGTVYRGDRLIPGADAAIGAIRAAGRRVAFLSNKPLQTRAEYAAKLTRLGVPAAPDEAYDSGIPGVVFVKKTITCATVIAVDGEEPEGASA